MAWKDDHEICQECFELALKTESNPIKRARMMHVIDCPIHSHPGRLPLRLAAWIDFYKLVVPYSTPSTIDHELITKICAEYELNWAAAFEKLTLIHRIFVDANQRDQEVDTGHGKAQG